jgi:hypothetical protein
MHASCESPWHSLAKHCILETCFLLTVPFRGMLLTPQGGPRCLAPTAHQIPVYLMVFSTFLCRAFTAHYLYTPRSCDIPPLCFTARRRLEVHDQDLVTARCVSTGNQGLNCPQHRRAAVHHSIRWNVEFSSPITRLYLWRDFVCRPTSEGTHKGTGVATSGKLWGPCETTSGDAP